MSLLANRSLRGVVAAVWLAASMVSLGAPAVAVPANTAGEPDVLLLILRIRQDWSVELLDHAPRWGAVPDHSPQSRALVLQETFLRSGERALLEYEIRSTREEELAKGYFVVSLEGYSEAVDPTRGGITERAAGQLKDLVIRLPIPYHPEAARLDFFRVEAVEPAEIEHAARVSLGHFDLQEETGDVLHDAD